MAKKRLAFILPALVGLLVMLVAVPAGAQSEPLDVSTTSLGVGEVNVAYAQTVEATGGTEPYAWAVTTGDLPAGVTLDADTGELTGTPTASGTYTFTVEVTDDDSDTATQSLSITVANAVDVATVELSHAQLNVAYAQTLTTTGGIAPYTWSITDGALPAGMSLNASTGMISGTATATGSSDFTVEVTDAAGGTASQELTLTVNAVPALAITTTELPKAKVGVAYSTTLAATGGVAPYTWSLIAGDIPAGLSLSSTGVIAGTPAEKDTGIFALKVTDANGTTAARILMLTVKQGEQPPKVDFDAKVLAACDAQTDSHPALNALCRIYTSGQLGLPAQHVIGRVILKLSDHHEAKLDARANKADRKANDIKAKDARKSELKAKDQGIKFEVQDKATTVKDDTAALYEHCKDSVKAFFASHTKSQDVERQHKDSSNQSQTIKMKTEGHAAIQIDDAHKTDADARIKVDRAKTHESQAGMTDSTKVEGKSKFQSSDSKWDGSKRDSHSKSRNGWSSHRRGR